MSTSFIRFVLHPQNPKKKTKEWEVWSGNHCLGLVKWYAAWRCYSFFPQPCTLFERKCLRDLANFCEEETNAHRRK